MEDTRPGFGIQWHITARCDQRCGHCYLMNDKDRYDMELKNELSFDDCVRVIDSYLEFCNAAEAAPTIGFTGGDPLLREDFFEIMQYAHDHGIRKSVMGNPYHLTPDIIVQMKRLEVTSYQLSMDGMEAFHDKLRKPGSFQATVEAIKMLKACGMRSTVMFTLSPDNTEDLFRVMRLVSKLKVDSFAFARYSCGADNSSAPGEMFSPEAYRDIMIRYQEVAKELKEKGSVTKFGHKDHLWKLYFYEKGTLQLRENERNQVVSGCHIGKANLAVLSDGIVYACRRFRSPVGKVPEQSFLDVYTSDELNTYRQVDRFEKCSGCELLNFCRGCPAIAHSTSRGNYFAPDPQCWKIICS